MDTAKEISSICNDLKSLFDIEKIYIFGVKRSETDGRVTDVDICVVSELECDKNAWLKKAYLEIDSSIPFDLFLYTSKEWSTLTQDKASFASRILRNGYKIYEKK